MITTEQLEQLKYIGEMLKRLEALDIRLMERQQEIISVESLGLEDIKALLDSGVIPPGIYRFRLRQREAFLTG